MNYETFSVTLNDGVASIAFNRPEKSNAINETGWREMRDAFETFDQMPEVRVVILSGEGKNFCAGIDLNDLMSVPVRYAPDKDHDQARRREQFRNHVLYLQKCISAIERCRKPVLAAIHRACVGGGVDVVTACDMRYSTQDAFFAIAEVDMGLVADIGTLQRLPKLIGDGKTREMAYTGRRVFGPEAEKIGLVNQVFEDKEAMMAEVYDLATQIAAKSPLVIRGTKEMITYVRDHSVEDALNYVAVWNAAFLMSDDIMEAFQAKMEKRPPTYKN